MKRNKVIYVEDNIGSSSSHFKAVRKCKFFNLKLLLTNVEVVSY